MVGFTLIELLLTITIMAIFIAGIVVLINPGRKIRQAKDARIKSDIGEISVALQSYYTLNNMIYPLNLDSLANSGDIKTVPKMPNGNQYSYSRTEPCTTSFCEAVAYGQLQEQEDNVWCWRSWTGEAVETIELLCQL